LSIRHRQEVDASEFYAAKRLRCPSCAASATVSAEDLVVKASDVLFDQCPRFEAVVLIDMSHGTLARGKVGFEAFADAASAYRAATELIARQQQDQGQSP
jgi:Zn-finger nucleic acid-binding protein